MNEELARRIITDVELGKSVDREELEQATVFITNELESELEYHIGNKEEIISSYDDMYRLADSLLDEIDSLIQRDPENIIEELENIMDEARGKLSDIYTPF
jgi:hypothetical protein